MKKVKKFLCALLVVVLCLTSVPFGGFDFTAEAADYQVGDIIQFGSYPQSEVKDEALIAELNALAPEWDEWTSYGYYSGNGQSGYVMSGDWMRYADIIYNGEKYRGVKFTQHRPFYTFDLSSYTYQDDNGYSTNMDYWFKFEPIAWRVLDAATGLVMCETIIDSQPYSNTRYLNISVSDRTYTDFNDSTYTNYASDYETSSIRQWLNNHFYSIAFTDSEKTEINITNLNNDGYFTSIGTTGYEALDCNETNDKIFLLSYNEVRNSAYGFSSDASVSGRDIARTAECSDYAKCQGIHTYGSSPWLLRSPGASSGCGCAVTEDGYCISYIDVSSTYHGIRPALKFIDIADIDTPTDNPTPDDPTPDDPTPDKPENTAGIIIDSDIYAVKVNGVETSKIFTILDSNIDFDKVTAWDIVLTVDGVETQPEGKVTVRIPVPVGYSAEKCKVYHIDPETGKLTDMNARVENGYFVFVTDHFSIYSVVELHEHSFGDKDAECSCGFDRTEGCSCNCHKGGIMGFFFKIILFFQRILGMNKECKCGIAHY